MSYSLGKLAKPTGEWSTVVDHAETFRIVRDTSIPTVGQTVNKVGKTTGWTSGRVLETCRNRRPTNDTEDNRMLLCQHRASYPFLLGDSGSPVFRIVDSPATNDVHLAGLAWAATFAGSFYSPVIKVHGELDSESVWNSCASGFGC